MKTIPFIILFLLFSCQNNSNSKHNYNNNYNLNELIDTYIFLSDNHELLHIMMGEHEGSPINSYNQYSQKINSLKVNSYLKPILHGLNKIKINNNNLDGAEKFDALVDYYQMGIQLMIEGILRGHGYNKEMPQNVEEYKKIKEINFL